MDILWAGRDYYRVVSGGGCGCVMGVFRLVCFLFFQDNVFKLFLVLMESRYDSENVERIFISLRFQELVRLGWRAGGRVWQGGVCGDGGQDLVRFTFREEVFEQVLFRQVDVIKKVYLQEEERENSEVSLREVGYNIYILALQVLVRFYGFIFYGYVFYFLFRRLRFVILRCFFVQFFRYNKQLQYLLKFVKRI